MAQTRKDGKVFIFGEEARKAILAGSKTVYDAVTLTYGPKGQNVAIEKSYGRPVITRDGVTVARESYLENRAENTGAQWVIEASQTTNRLAGDGTTATVALTHNLIDIGLKKIAAGVNPMEVKKAILDDSYKLLDAVEKLSTPVKDGQLKQVAYVSSGDELLGQLIAEAVEEVGPEGGLITEKAPISGVERTYVNGYYMQQGFTAINEGRRELEIPYIVVTNKMISSRMDAVELLTKVGKRAHEDQEIPLDAPLRDPLRVAFFGEIEGEAYNLIVANITQGAFDGTITKTPAMGDMGVQYLEDLAIYCGGKAIANGEVFANVDSSYIGRADKVTCTTSDTTIFGGHHVKEDFEKRKADIRDRLKKEEIDAIVEKLRDRLAKLENKVAMFRIGGATDTEKEEKEFRIEDAIQATRAAAANGVVTGGGMTLLQLSKIEDISDVTRDALRSVFKRLMENANLPAEVKLNEALKADAGFGFNLREGGELVNLYDAGVLDPTLVVQQIIENATSAAANAVSCGALITFIDKEE